MAEWLASQGDDVRVITAPPYYPAWKIGQSYNNRYLTEKDIGVKFAAPYISLLSQVRSHIYCI
jgi:hypothetical protein